VAPGIVVGAPGISFLVSVGSDCAKTVEDSAARLTAESQETIVGFIAFSLLLRITLGIETLTYPGSFLKQHRYQRRQWMRRLRPQPCGLL